MALYGNRSILSRIKAKQFATGISSNYIGATVPPGTQRNRYIGGFDKQSATPNGYSHPAAWIMAQSGGGMSTYQKMNASIIETVAILAGGVSISATGISSSIALTNAQLDQIVNLIMSFNGGIAVTNADLIATITAVPTFITSSINGTLTTTDAALGAIVDLIASFSGNISTTNAANFATFSMVADLSVNTGFATPEQIASEVWDTVLSDHQVTGSTGKALNDAGSAGNPWSSSLASNNTPGTFGYLVQKLLTVAKFLGLK